MVVNYAWPVVKGTPISSGYGPRWGTMHNGIDFAGNSGAPIYASKDGEVVGSMPTSQSEGFGEYIVIKHNDGHLTGYAHMSQRMKNVGDKVVQGQQIGTIGSTGDSTGPHLHFSIQTGLWGPYKDPALFLNEEVTKPLDPKRNFGVQITYFKENEVLDRLKEFRQAFPSYSSCLQDVGGGRYAIVIQLFSYLEVNGKKMEIQGKFPHWAMKVAELVEFTGYKGLLVAPFSGKEVGEKYLDLFKRYGFSMSIVPSPYGDAGRIDYTNDLAKKAVVISPFNTKEALEKLIEFRKAFPSYASGSFLQQVPTNAAQYNLVVQPFTVQEVNARYAEINQRFPTWMKNINNFHNVGDPKGVLIARFKTEEIVEKYLEVQRGTGYAMKIVDA